MLVLIKTKIKLNDVHSSNEFMPRCLRFWYEIWHAYDQYELHYLHYHYHICCIHISETRDTLFGISWTTGLTDEILWILFVTPMLSELQLNVLVRKFEHVNASSCKRFLFLWLTPMIYVQLIRWSHLILTNYFFASLCCRRCSFVVLIFLLALIDLVRDANF